MKILKFFLIILSILFFFSCKETSKNAQTIVANTPENVTLSSGTILRISDFPSKYIKPRNVDIWLPDNYSKKKKYAVLYMHDGQMLFDPTTTWNHQEWKVDETLSDLIKKDSIRDVIVAGVWNIPKNRHADYFPQKALEFIPQKQKEAFITKEKKQHPHLQPDKLNADNYLKFLVKELKPWIDHQFSTHTDTQNTFVAGSSMGGLISMYAVCEYPDIFSGAACISTHWPGIMRNENNPLPDAFFSYMKARLPSPDTHRFYFDYGTKTLDSLYLPYAQSVDEVFRAKDATEHNYKNLKFEGADHSENSWNQRLYIPFHFLLKK